MTDMYTDTICEVTLENQNLIIDELDSMCNQSLSDNDLNNKEKLATNGIVDGKLIYRSYNYSLDDNTTLTKLLNDQQIFPTNYLCSLLYGQDGSYKPHSDKHRLLSIMYLKTDEPATTNFYESKIGRKKGFYEFDEVDLLKETVIERNKLYLFNHQTVHSVTDVYKLRCNISINLSNIE